MPETSNQTPQPTSTNTASTQSAAGPKSSRIDSISSTRIPRGLNSTEDATRTEAQVETPVETPTDQQPVQRSFITDVANLMDSLTAAFTAHPELSEGLRNIVRGATSGAYWSVERERAANAAENIRRAAEETSQRATQAADDARYNAEQRIAQSLAGVFKVIGELSGGLTGLSSEESTTAAYANNRPSVSPPPGHHGWGHMFPPPPPPPFGHPVPPPFGPAPPLVPPPPHILYPSIGFGAPPPQPPHSVGHTIGNTHRSMDSDLHDPPHLRTRPWSVRYAAPRDSPQRSNSWSVGPATGNTTATSQMFPYAPPETSAENELNAFERKARLDAAKQYYRQQKEEFRKEKERRRQLRLEQAEKRAEEGLK